MPRLAVGYIATAIVFMAMDACWLTLTGARLYMPVLGPMMTSRVDLGAALAFYAIYVLGLVAFAVRPGLASGRIRTVALSGALLGLVSYATYDLTNQATLRLWSLKITIFDLGWGVTVSAIASTCGYLAARAFGRSVR